MLAYLRFAPYAAIGLLVIALLWYRSDAIDKAAQRDAARVEVKAVQEANKSNIAALERLTRQREADDKILEDLNKSLAAMNAHNEAVRGDIARLERSNEEVRQYLANPLPAALRSLLNNPVPNRE